MYQSKFQQLTFENFHLPFGGKLDPENRWVKLADVIPWHVAETMYAKNFMSKRGAPALTVRMALGSLIIKEKLGLSDIETVEQIKENPYLQFFIGLEAYQQAAPFDSSMLTHFRKRLKHTDLAALQEELLQRHLAEERKRAQDREENKDGDDDGNVGPANKGKLIVDATCAPADIAYPTDISLLNDAREKTERIIDKLCEMHPEGVAKPRMSRRTARKDFLAVGMKKSLSRKALRKGLRKQLSYLRRNLQYIGGLSASVPLTVLSKRLYRDLLVIDELYRQQLEMYKTEKKSISDRIVSISQPHVRPIVRGKAAAKTEFGMKLSISVVDGISMPERMSWNAYNEGCDLVRDIERYRERYGRYPESVHADKIYRTLANRQWCKERGIRLSGVPLGRPPKDVEKNRARRRQIREDEGIRNAVEGKFGQAKRRYGPGRVMARLAESSLCVVSITFLVMNLDRLLAAPFLRLFEWLLLELDVIRNLFKWSSSRATMKCCWAMA
ncbi:IS5 family transposase [Chlorobium phaeovibrioides]|uniref:IS5 family transposase n=1 Tax=Chlorobium phaeovibrioides TaxID=1094 RepID=A0A5M8IDS0_CHLPH|nr:IS5 family transposase [Chlorobium phaeovibrioides]KAA6233137.1 IS5 family transposase [Chlorobium phaeovibrioides]